MRHSILRGGDAGACDVELERQEKRPGDEQITLRNHASKRASCSAASSPSTAKARHGQPSPSAIFSGSAAKKTFGPVSLSRLQSPSTIDRKSTRLNSSHAN